MNAPNHSTLKGSIERITFYNDENGYTVARFVAERPSTGSGYGEHSRDPITVVGNMLGVNIGETTQKEQAAQASAKINIESERESVLWIKIPRARVTVRRAWNRALVKASCLVAPLAV